MDSSFDFVKLLQTNEKKHKSIPAQFASVAGGVKKRFENELKKRKSVRLSVFDRIRNLSSTESLKPVKEIQSKVEHRRIQLEKWKEEKEKKKKEALMNKKKPFIVGKPHNSLKFVLPQPLKTMPSTSGRVTRSQTKNSNTNISKQKVKDTNHSKNQSQPQSFAPKNATFNPVLKNIARPTLIINNETVQKDAVKTKSKSVPKLCEPRNLRSRAVDKKNKVLIIVKGPSSSSSNSSVEIEDNTKPIEQIILTPNYKVPKSESGSEEKLRSSKVLDMMTPEQIAQEARKISPCVTLSRGKDKARDEMKKKIKEGLLNDDVCEMDRVEYFRHQLDSEMKRLTELCDTWSKILEQMVLPDAVQEAILAAVGQARLLMTQKLQQFASLLLRCECPEPTQALVTPGDLHGFWDMVFMQVTNVDMRFKKLEEMRARGWQEEQPVLQKKKIITKAPVNKSKPAANSRLRDMIAAARKAKKDQQTSTDIIETKNFEAGFFSVTSPVKSPKMPSTPNQSLLKAVLSNETKKASASKSAASYAMLRASLIGKNVDVDTSTADPTQLTPINYSAIPAKSILKSSTKKSVKKPSRKSVKVLFNNSDDEAEPLPKNEEQHKEIVEIDSGVSSIDIEEKENKTKRRSKLLRQDAFEERSPVMTRSRRKSVHTPQADDRSRTNLQEVNVKLVETPRRSGRKSAL